MIKKLRQKRGETLVETLVSMLIAVLCMGLLCGAVLAATKINQQAREMDEKFQEELKEVEGLETPEQITTNLVIQFQPQDGTSAYQENVTVTLYGGADSAFLSYDYEGDMP